MSPLFLRDPKLQEALGPDQVAHIVAGASFADEEARRKLDPSAFPSAVDISLLEEYCLPEKCPVTWLEELLPESKAATPAAGDEDDLGDDSNRDPRSHEAEDRIMGTRKPSSSGPKSTGFEMGIIRDIGLKPLNVLCPNSTLASSSGSMWEPVEWTWLASLV